MFQDVTWTTCCVVLLVEEEVSHSLVGPLLQLYARLHTGAEARVNQLIEIISDIRMPITNTQTRIITGCTSQDRPQGNTHLYP